MVRLLTSAAALVLLTTGCGGPSTQSSDSAVTPSGGGVAGAEHFDPHDIPLTEDEIATLKTETSKWSSAIGHLQEYRDTIRTETTVGDPAKAHRALDLVDHVLEWLPEIAQRSRVPREQWQIVGENAQAIRDSFNAVHENIDAGKDPDYEQFADQIDASVTALTGVTPGDSGSQ